MMRVASNRLNSQRPGKRIRMVLTVLLLAGLALRLVFAFISLENFPLSTDESLLALQAKQIARGERPLLVLAQPYQFPLGAYLQSVLVEQMPRSAWGARSYALGLGLLCFLGLWLLLRRMLPPAKSWPGLLLVAFPSAYLLLYQAAYAVPQYDTMLALWLLAAWATFLMKGRSSAVGMGLALLVGLASGLAISGHMLALSLLAPMVLAACLQGGWRRAPFYSAALILGLGLGLLPLLLVNWFVPEAAGMVSGRRSLADAFSLHQLLVMKHAMAGVLGAFPHTFPDFHESVSLGRWAGGIFFWGYLGLLLAAGAVSLWGLLSKGPEQKPASGIYSAVFAAAPWLGMLFFLLSNRSDSGQYRYLIALAWCLPFLVAQVHAALGRRLRPAMGALAVLLAAFNLATALLLMSVWTKPDFAEKHASMPDPAPAMAYLKQEGIDHCMASYWTAYRISFMSDEKLLCSQPVNERFSHWPAPYKDEVLAAPRAAYVLTKPDSTDTARLEGYLRQCGITSKKTRAGRYTVYQDFALKEYPWERLLPRSQVSFEVSHNPQMAPRLGDGVHTSKWHSDQGQEKGMWLEVRLKEPAALSRVTLFYHNYSHDQAKVLAVSYLADGQWHTIQAAWPAGLDKCVMANQLPVFGELAQSLRFAPVKTQALRLEIAEPHPGRLWTVAEVEVFCDQRQGCPPKPAANKPK